MPSTIPASLPPVIPITITIPNPNLYEVLPFSSMRLDTVATAKEHGPANHPYTQANLIERLQIEPRDLQALLKVIEVIFDNTVDAKPVTSHEFRWFPDAPNAIVRQLNDLPFPVDLVSRVLTNLDMRSEIAVNEIGFYMYHVALAAKKRVGRRKREGRKERVDKLAEMEKDMAGLSKALRSLSNGRK